MKAVSNLGFHVAFFLLGATSTEAEAKWRFWRKQQPHSPEAPPASTMPIIMCSFLVSFWLLGTLHYFVKHRMGIKREAPNWQVYAKLFPTLFPQIVAVIWSCVGCIPCEVLIGIHMHMTRWSRSAVWNFCNEEGAQGKVALTIDDAPVRPDGTPLMNEVLEVLAEYNATASFFVVTTFMEQREEVVREIVERGHEICNHGSMDIAYHNHSKDAFERVLLECETKIDSCLDAVNSASPPAPDAVNRRNNKWFRPPHAKMSSHMLDVLQKHGFRIAMSDCYAMDVMCRPPFIANFTARHARPGNAYMYQHLTLSLLILDTCAPALTSHLSLHTIFSSLVCT
jgi:peptidoglycan/xylan/chitin deacetylase (PgdA/CDA1 family)